MNADATLGVALVLTVVLSLAVSTFLRTFLDRVLANYCGSPDRGHFWGRMSTVVLLGLPLWALTLDAQMSTPAGSALVQVMRHLRWPILALVIGAIGIGVAVMALHLPRDLPMSRAEVDDLRRLLDRVEEMRSREILSRATPPAASSQKMPDPAEGSASRDVTELTRDPFSAPVTPRVR